MQNVHERLIHASADELGALLKRFGSESDVLWPKEHWPRAILDNGTEVGSRGGHGVIRYWVSESEPGRRVRFAFEPEVGIDGFHEIEIVAVSDIQSRLIHSIRGRTRGSMLLLWPLAVRWVHEAVIHDLFDNAERATAGRVARPRRWSPFVRLLRRVAPKEE